MSLFLSLSVLVLMSVLLRRFTSLIFLNSVSSSGLLRPATTTDEFGELKLSKFVVLFSTTVLLATICSLATYFNLCFSFGGFTFSNLGLGGGLFLFGVGNVFVDIVRKSVRSGLDWVGFPSIKWLEQTLKFLGGSSASLPFETA